jgi:hypothetical protein
LGYRVAKNLLDDDYVAVLMNPGTAETTQTTAK